MSSKCQETKHKQVAKSSRFCPCTFAPSLFVTGFQAKQQQLVCALFPSAWRTLSPDALFTKIWDTRKHPVSCFPCWYPGALSPEMPIVLANAKLPNYPGFGFGGPESVLHPLLATFRTFLVFDRFPWKAASRGQSKKACVRKNLMSVKLFRARKK